MTTPSIDPPAPTPHRLGRATWAAMACGGAITSFGIVGLLGAEGNGLGSFIPYFVGGALVLDLIVAPVAAAIGLIGRRVVPAPAWPAVRSALLASATLVVFALPLVLDLGGTPGNASLRPRRYGSGLAISIVAVCSVALVVGSLSLLHDRRVKPIPSDPPPIRERSAP